MFSIYCRRLEVVMPPLGRMNSISDPFDSVSSSFIHFVKKMSFLFLFVAILRVHALTRRFIGTV